MGKNEVVPTKKISVHVHGPLHHTFAETGYVGAKCVPCALVPHRMMHTADQSCQSICVDTDHCGAAPVRAWSTGRAVLIGFNGLSGLTDPFLLLVGHSM